jgi:hypothetical protein
MGVAKHHGLVVMGSPEIFYASAAAGFNVLLQKSPKGFMVTVIGPNCALPVSMRAFPDGNLVSFDGPRLPQHFMNADQFQLGLKSFVDSIGPDDFALCHLTERGAAEGFGILMTVGEKTKGGFVGWDFFAEMFLRPVAAGAHMVALMELCFSNRGNEALIPAIATRSGELKAALAALAVSRGVPTVVNKAEFARELAEDLRLEMVLGARNKALAEVHRLLGGADSDAKKKLQERAYLLRVASAFFLDLIRKEADDGAALQGLLDCSSAPSRKDVELALAEAVADVLIVPFRMRLSCALRWLLVDFSREHLSADAKRAFARLLAAALMSSEEPAPAAVGEALEWLKRVRDHLQELASQ